MALVCNVAWADFTDTWTNAPTPWSATAAENVPNGVTVCAHTAGVSESNPHTIHMAETAVTTKGGTLTVTFTWTSGNHMLKIVGVDLVDANGDVVKSDYHEGQAGGTHSNNTYTLTEVPAGDYTLRYFVCQKKTGNNGHSLTNTGGTITITGMDIAGTVAEAEMEALLTDAQAAYGCTGVGYPVETAPERTTLKTWLDVALAGEKTSKNNYLMLQLALAAYKNCTNILLPEDGKAYTFTNCSRYTAQPLRYLNYTENQALSMKTNASEASVFVCKKLRNGVYVFITEDGKYMTWMGGKDGYTMSGTRYGYSNVYMPSQNEKTDWNEITIAQHTASGVDSYTGTNADFFGMLHMTGRRSGSAFSSFIVKGKDGGWDHASTTKFFQNSNSYCSSAWYITEATHTNTDAQNVALAKIDAKEHVKPYASKVGDGIGCAYYLVEGQEQYTDVNAAIDAATTVDAVNEIKESFKFKVPQAGVLYALYDATHSVYLDIHNLGKEKNDASYTQLATLNTTKQFLYVSGNETDGTWKIHTTSEGGSYLHQSSSRSWNSWVSDAGGAFSWEVEPIVENEQLVYKLKNVSGNQNGYLGADNHTDGSSLYVNSANALKLSLASATPEEDLAYTKSVTKSALTEYTAKLKNQPGYYYCTINGAKVYDAAGVNTAIDAAKTKEAVAEIVAAVKAPSVVLPEPGKAYTMTLVANNNEKTQYKIIATDGKLEAKTEGENSVFYCLQSNSNDYPYIFVSEDGYVLGYSKLVANYHSGDNRHNFKVEGMYDKSSEYIKSAAADRLGMVCITTASRNPDTGGGSTGCLIFKYTANSATAWDNSSAPYHNGTYTSAIIMAEVESYSIPEAQQTKIDAILGKDALKTQVEAIRNDLKNQPGYYYCTIGGEKIYDADDIIAAIDATQSLKTLNEISTAVAGKTLIVPEVGKYYRLKGKTSGNYIDASGQDKAQMNMKAEPDYLGSIFLLDEDSKWLNMSTGTYVYNTHSIGETKANANTWTFILASTGYFKVKSNYSSPWLHDSGNKANRCQNDGSDHEFIIEEVKAITLTIDAPAAAGATATWNGETKALPATWAILKGISITNPALTLNYDNVNYTFGGLYEGEEQVELPATIAELSADRNFTAKFTPAFFSASTAAGDLVPVQIYNMRDKGYTICLNDANNYTGNAVNSGTTEYALNEVWYLVGNAESFKMYSRTAGMDLALTLAGNSEGSAATMTANGTELRLITKDNYYYITPKTNTNQSFNMLNGKGNDIKLYRATDGGSSWGINVMDIEHSLTYSVTVSGTPWDDRYGVGELTFDVKGISSNTHITEAVAAQACYLPKNATFTLSSIPYRGYTFSISGEAESYEGTLAEGNITLELAYTANEEKILFHTPKDNHPYRIPAIATAPNGDIFAICDYRPCNKDIGYGEVDLVCRISKDNGETWGEEFKIADGDGGNTNRMETGYGDPAIVVDRESNKILVMMVCGRTICHNGQWNTSKEGDPNAAAVNRVARIYGTYNETSNEWEWTQPEEVTDGIYKLFLDENNNPTVPSMFIGSGKICQSRVVKKGEYYRLYCSIWTNNGGNRVIYSDNFGESWNVLGTVGDRPGPGGDEPKVEELPDGTVVLSSRVGGGRIFNLFTFNNDGEYTTGSWGTAVQSNKIANGLSFGGNSTNGEIYKVKAIHKDTGRICNLMLQSVPTGSGRSDVAVFYKELDEDTYTPTTIAQGWTKGKHVSYKSSCYSTMILQADGRIGFFFEEDPGEYCMVYIPYTLEDLTANQYSLYTVNSTIGQYGVGTFYASEAMQIPEGVSAYVAEKLEMEGETGNRTGVLTLTELEGIIPAKTGALIYGAADTYNFIPSISYGTPRVDNMLVGFEADNTDPNSTKEVTVEADYTTYVLTVQNEKAGFYRKAQGATFYVANNKAYLQVTQQAQGANALRISFSNEENNEGEGTTGVEMTTLNSQPRSTTSWVAA